MPETSRSFHYWQPAPRWTPLPWLANPGKPAMSPHAKPEDLQLGLTLLGEKRGSWLGKPEPQREMPKSDGTQKSGPNEGKRSS